MFFQNNLKQARKRAKLSIQDMAYILDYDASNLSSYERGSKPTPLHITFAYHIISNQPLLQFFRTQILEVSDKLASRVIDLTTELEEEIPSRKSRKRIEALEEVFSNITCLRELISENNSKNVYED